MAAVRHLGFCKVQFLRFGTVRSTHARHAKFLQNRLIGWRDIAILQFSKIAAAAILDFQKIKFLPADTLERSNLRNPAKFHQDRPIHC